MSWIFGLLLSQSAVAFSPQDYVVKVNSTLAHGEAYEGSGVLVQFRGAVYVLTSEHVVFHDNKEAAHSITKMGTAPQGASYVVSDWGMGLALLKTRVAPSVGVPDLAELDALPAPGNGSAAMAVGFPLHSGAILASAGQVSATNHSSMVLADVEYMLEISVAHGEFGMSGGAVTDSSGALLGLLSHQAVDAEKSTLYAVPITVAAKWARRFLEDPAAKPRLVRTNHDMLSSLQGGETVRSGPMVVQWAEGGAGIINGTPGPDFMPRVLFTLPENLFFPDPSPATEPYTGISWWSKVTQRMQALRADHKRRPEGEVDIGAFRPRDLLQYPSYAGLLRTTGLVQFFRLAQNPNLKPLSRVYYTDQFFPFQNDDYAGLLHTISYNAITAGGKLGPMLAVVDRLTRLHQYCEGTDWDDAGRCMNPIQWPVESVEAFDLDDVTFLLDDPSFAADWAGLTTSDRTSIRDALTRLGKYYDDFSL